MANTLSRQHTGSRQLVFVKLQGRAHLMSSHQASA